MSAAKKENIHKFHVFRLELTVTKKNDLWNSHVSQARRRNQVSGQKQSVAGGADEKEDDGRTTEGECIVQAMTEPVNFVPKEKKKKRNEGIDQLA
jgi:hypothetical protein